MSLACDVVLSGGSTRAICAHAGYLEGLAAHDVVIERMACTSAGALVGALNALGYRPRDIWEKARLLQFGDYVRIPWMAPLKFLIYGWIDDGDGLRKLLDELFRNKTLSDTRWPISIVTSNVTKGEVEILDWQTAPKMRLAEAVYMSVAIPGVFRPHIDERGQYLDGGLYAHLPVRVLGGAHYPQLAHLVGGHDDAPKYWGGLGTLELVINATVDANVSTSLAECSACDRTWLSTSVGPEVGLLDFDLDDQTKSIYRQIGLANGLSIVKQVRGEQ